MMNFGSDAAPRAILSRPRLFTAAILIQLLALSVFSHPVAVPVPTAKAVEYQNLSNLVWGIKQILTLLLPILFLISGIGTRILAKTQRYGKYLTFTVFAAIFFALNSLIQLPLERIRINKLNQTIGDAGLPLLQWISGQLVQSLPTIILSTAAALLVFWLINRSSRSWWLWATGIFSILFLVFLVGEPFTENYKPLGRTPVEIKILLVAGRVGIPKDAIALDTCEPIERCEDARVIGLGPTRVVLLNEEYIHTRPENWTIQTFSHESKHFVKDDNLMGWVVLTLIFLVCFWLVDQICKATIRRFSDQLGFNSISQAAALPLVILVLTLIYLIALPPVNLFRQHVEFEADRYGLELTGESQVLGEMVSNWTAESPFRVPDPGLFFMLFRSSHPSDASRIAFANEFDAKNRNQ